MITNINSEFEYNAALREIEELIDREARAGTPEGDRLNVLTLLTQDYENRTIEKHAPDPVDAIKFRMEQMSLQPRDLVPLLGSRSKVSEVLSRKRPLTLSMIRALHKGLGIPAKALLSQELLDEPAESDIQWEKFPIRAMIARGWIRPDVSVSVKQLMRRFLSPLGPHWTPAALYKRTHYIRSARQMDHYALAAWNARVCIRAVESPPPVAFYRDALSIQFMHELAHLSILPDGPRHAKEYLEKIGVSVVIEPHLPETYLDGASLLVKPDWPVIGLTLRHDRLDNFWFVLMHEVIHIARHLGEHTTAFFDDLDVEDTINAQEQEADDLASEVLIPTEEWSKSPASMVRSPEAVEHLAQRLRIHPAIVAGRIRYHHKSYRVLNRFVGQGQVRILFPETRKSDRE